MNPYQQLVSDYARLAREGRSYPLARATPALRPALAADAPKALIFSPHPDDECIIGALALRLLREAAMNVINVAVTQGSRKERQAERLHELEDACRYLGFGLLTICFGLRTSAPNGLENITLQTRTENKMQWDTAVEVIAKILKDNEPAVIFLPHERDWHPTHIGTHFLVTDALKLQSAAFSCCVVETEFWGAMDTPNLMVESSVADVTDLVTALTFHVGEVRRNPYHILLPAWLQDNVRRGSELVGGAGGTAPDFAFATLYRLRRWRQGKFDKMFDGGKQLSCQMNPAALFA